MSTPTNDSDETLHCSFCGKSQHDVNKLIVGPSCSICNECIGLGMDLLRLNGNAYAIEQPPSSCGFCQKNQLDEITLMAGPKCAICNECFDLCTDILREEEKIDAIKKGLAT